MGKRRRAVSYTHLDVYKRQEETDLDGISGLMFGDASFQRFFIDTETIQSNNLIMGDQLIELLVVLTAAPHDSLKLLPPPEEPHEAFLSWIGGT